MKIDRKLNLVIPVETDQGKIYVHSVAISREVFEKYFKVISKTYTDIFKEGAAYIAGAGPKISNLMLKETAKDMGIDVSGLLLEIKRLTNVVCMGDAGWETLPYTIALSRGYISDDELSDVEGQIVFFILNSAMTSKKELPEILETVNGFWGSQTVSSNCTELAASLPILTQEENSGEKRDSLLPA